MNVSKLIIAFAIIASTLYAQEAKVLLDFTGKDKSIKLEIGTENDNLITSKKSDDLIRCYGKNELTDQWQKYTASFIPDQSGFVKIVLRGPLPKALEKTPVCVAYDAFTVTGGTLTNPDFEEVNVAGKFTDWWNVKDNVVKGKAQSGEYYAKVWFNVAVAKSIKVTEDQMVTVTFYAKLP